MQNLIRYEFVKDQEYGLITINRPEKRNAISIEMAESFLQTIEQAKKDPIKFLVVTGMGTQMFCSGGDLNDLHGNLSVKEAERNLLKMMEVLYELTVFEMPTIALLNGGATGGGCELASACDIRFAKENSKFGFVQTNLGIIPGWGGGVLLAKRVHRSFAYQWIMEGTIFELDFLVQMGWLHRQVVEDEWLDRDKLLQPYLAKSFRQMKILKEQYLEEIGVIGLKEKMIQEVQNCASLWESEEHKRAVLAFFNRS